MQYLQGIKFIKKYKYTYGYMSVNTVLWENTVFSKYV